MTTGNLTKYLKKGLFLPLALAVQFLSAQSLDVTMELPGGQMTYKKLFGLIETKAHVWFGYSTDEVDVDRVIEVPAGTVRAGSLLDSLFAGTNYRYTIAGRHVIISVDDRPAEPEAEEVEDAVFEYREPYRSSIPVVALKTNLLYDLTTTMNLGIEIGLSRRWTIDIPFNYNPWVFNDETRLRHWGVQPEVRYWTCQRFDGWFIGLHGHYAKFNMGGWPDWSIVSTNMQRNRYQGYLYGGGVSFGHSWILKKRWSLEATLGVGYARLVYDKYPCTECGTAVKKKDKHYFGPTKAGVSLVFMIK